MIKQYPCKEKLEAGHSLGFKRFLVELGHADNEDRNALRRMKCHPVVIVNSEQTAREAEKKCPYHDHLYFVSRFCSCVF